MLFVLLVAFILAQGQQLCSSKLELVMVLDGSGSISASDWQQAKAFSSSLAATFKFGPENTRVAAVQFSGRVRTEFPLNGNKDEVLGLLQGLQKNLGTGTDIAGGIDAAGVVLQQSRPGALRSILLITDGAQSVPGDPIASANKVKVQNIEMFVVAVGAQAAKYQATLSAIASEPKGRHFFAISGFETIKDILSKIVNATCPSYTCTQSPTHGPAEGGTLITVTGANFPTTGSPKCMFGSTIVDAKVVNPTTLQCTSPAGPKGQTVIFQVSFDGNTWLNQGCQFAYDIAKVDPCAQFANCSFCISHPFCGWCSQNVTHPDGTPGAQCAGFRHAAGGDEQEFTCVGQFNTEQCVPGYLCNQTTATCQIVAAGNGGDKDTCNRNCGVGLIYRCDKSLNQCIQCENGTPGCVSSRECRDDCSIPLPPSADTNSTPGTPRDLAFTIWRGIQINRKYTPQELQLKFDSTKAYLWGVETKVLKTFTVSHTEDTVWLTSTTDGKTSKARYVIHYVGQVVSMTLATGAPGGGTPSGFDPAMIDPTNTVHVFGRCLNSATCTFHYDGQNQKRSQFQIHDYCMNFTSCDSCIAQGTCGWCSNNVVYTDGTIGRNCAGFDPNGGKKPFVCSGAFSSDTCLSAPKTYECEPRSQKCIESRPGFGFDFDTCNLTCGRPLPPAQNVTPIALQGNWRGLQLQKDYQVGEFKAVFGNTNMELTFNDRVILAGDVQSVEDQLFIYTLNGYVRGKWQIVNGPETRQIGLAFGPPGGPVPFDFGEAMITPGMSEYWFQSCLPQKESAAICIWDQ